MFVFKKDTGCTRLPCNEHKSCGEKAMDVQAIVDLNLKSMYYCSHKTRAY